MSGVVVLTAPSDVLHFEVGHVETHPVAMSARATGTYTITGIDRDPAPLIGREELATITGESIAWEWLEKARATYRGGADVHQHDDGTATIRSEHFEVRCHDSTVGISEAMQAIYAKEIGRKARKLMERALR